MKNDQYIPHEVSTRSNSQVMNLIEAEGAAGYGFYWAMLEYLRAQQHYTGDTRAVRNIARQLKVRIDKALRVLNNYNLFVVDKGGFHSPMLTEKMLPLERKRAKICPEDAVNVSEAPCNSLKDRNASFKEEKRKEEKNKEDSSSPKSSSSSSAGEEAAAETKLVSILPAWERYIDELEQEEQWKELMAMRTGLKQQFYSLYPRIVENFKRHIRLLGNEGHILSPSEAKRYFCFFLDPGSVTFKRLWEELQKPANKGKYRFEDCHPSTGKRSYCGVPIPDDAPPRPNDQAVWEPELKKWVF